MSLLFVFDCDGTLVDSEPIAARVEAELLAALGVDVTTDEVLDRFTGLSAAATRRLAEQRWGVHLGEDFDAEKAARLEAAFAAELRPVAGIPELIDRLTGPRCVASSSGLSRISSCLEVTGLARSFPPATRFSATMVERGKPAPDLFLLASERMGVPADRCVVVEDSPYGVEAGVAAGMAVIGLTAGSHCRPGLRAQLRAAGATAVAADAAELAAHLSC
ncbi:MAG: HAD family hydrolase [Acidimicrobiales bacterium]